MMTVRLKKNERLRIIVSGGGTGGHIYPALAVAEAMKQRFNAEIIYMGALANLHGGPPREQELAENAGWPYIGVAATGLSRRSPRIALELLINFRGSLQAKKRIREFSPHLVIGTGGYAMAPVLRAAVSLKIPTMLHEQNAYPGWANRYLAPKVDMVCLSFAAAKEHFPAQTRIRLTGLPVRRDIIAASREEALKFWHIAAAEQERPTLLVTGGSQGARHLNEAICAVYADLLDSGLRIIHLTGEAHYKACLDAAAACGRQENLHVLPYLKEMEHALAVADMVAGRAGASFLAEIAVRGLPSILVPYPFAAGNHQSKNAEAFVTAGAALLIEDADLRGETLKQATLMLLQDKPRWRQMSAAAHSLAQADATEKILATARELVKKRL